MSDTTRRIICTVLFFCFYAGAWAHEKGVLRFVPNMGQWDAQVLYKAEVQDGAVFFTGQGFRYSFYNPQDLAALHNRPINDQTIIRGHAYDVQFAGSRPATTKGGENYGFYHNYFLGNDTGRWATMVPVFHDVKYTQLYPYIDMHVYSTGTSMKYDLLVQPGGDISDILLEYKGVAPYVNERGDLVIETSVNTVTEQAPYAYQLTDGIATTVPCRYVMKGKKLSFYFPAGYDKTKLLVIDPVLKFATYTGSLGQLYGYSAAYDAVGNFYSGSEAFSNGFPVTTGAYQVTYKGNDLAINKYNSTGDTLLYSTYCGGATGGERPTAMAVNNYNELIVMGCTYSSDYPVTPSAVDTTYNGMGDVFVSVFSANGSNLVGATYIGGTNIEGISPYAFHDNDENKTGLCTDPQGNVYIAGATQSKDMPVNTWAYQPKHSSAWDAFVFKLSRSCASIIYGTYLGGNHHDCIYDCKVTANGNLAVCGRTRSDNFPVSNGAYSDTGNAFISVLNTTGQYMVASTRLGAHTESALKLSLDDNGNVFVCGNNDTALNVSPGTYNEPNGKVFIAKMTPALDSMIVSTKLVSQVLPGVTGFVNICGDVVGSVLLKEMKPLPVTPDAYQSAPAAYYFFHLSPAFDTLLYATTFGVPNDTIKGGHAHGWSVIDTNGTIWLSTCNKESKYSLSGTPNSYCPGSLNGIHNYDHLSVKFDMQVLPAKPFAAAVIPDTVCAKTNVIFKNNSINAYSYIWHFGDGDTSHAKNAGHIYDTPGYYRVKLEAYNLYSCRIVDSLLDTVYVDTNEIYSSFASVDTICIGKTVYFYNSSKNGVSNYWDFGDGNNTNTFHAQHSYAVAGTYTVRLVSYNPDFCNKTDTAIKVLVVDTTSPGANFAVDKSVACAGMAVQFTNHTGRGTGYIWDFGDGGTTNTIHPSHSFTSGGKHTIRLIAVNNNLCVPRDTAYGAVEILPPLQIDLPDSFICGGNKPVEWSIRLMHVNSFPTYKWEPAHAILSGADQPTATVDLRITTKYYVTVTDSIPGMCSHERRDTAHLIVVDYPEGVTATSNSPLCEGDTLRLEGNTSSTIPFITYSWTGPDGFTSSKQHSGRENVNRSQAGMYRLGVSNQGCITYADAEVIVKPSPGIEATSNSPVLAGRELRLSMTSDTEVDSLSWSGPLGFHSGSKDPVIHPVKLEHSGAYTVTAMKNGCRSSSIIMVTVSEVDTQYLRLFPNPNNGTFFLEGRGLHEQEIKMLIVNSIGQKLYRADVNTEKKHFKHQVIMPHISDGVYIIWVLIDGEYKGLPFTVLGD